MNGAHAYKYRVDTSTEIIPVAPLLASFLYIRRSVLKWELSHSYGIQDQALQCSSLTPKSMENLLGHGVRV